MSHTPAFTPRLAWAWLISITAVAGLSPWPDPQGFFLDLKLLRSPERRLSLRLPISTLLLHQYQNLRDPGSCPRHELHGCCISFFLFYNSDVGMCPLICVTRGRLTLYCGLLNLGVETRRELRTLDYIHMSHHFPHGLRLSSSKYMAGITQQSSPTL